MKVIKSDTTLKLAEKKLLEKQFRPNILIKYSKTSSECINCRKKYQYNTQSIKECAKCGNKFFNAFTKNKSIYEWSLFDLYRFVKNKLICLTYHVSVTQSREDGISKNYKLIRKIEMDADNYTCMYLKGLRVTNNYYMTFCDYDMGQTEYLVSSNHLKTAQYQFTPINNYLMRFIPRLAILASPGYAHHYKNEEIMLVVKYRKVYTQFIQRYKVHLQKRITPPNWNIATIKNLLKYEKQVSYGMFTSYFKNYLDWTDYYTFLTADEQKDLSIVFQANWQAVHDQRMMSKRIADSKDKTSQFKQRYAVANFTDIKIKDLYVVIPKGLQDLELESKLLKHCIRTYFDRIVDGDSLVLFIRKNKAEPLYTVEIRNNKVSDIRGQYNKEPDLAIYRNTINQYLKQQNKERLRL